MLDNRDLMNALETLETSDPALTDTEMQHLTRAVLTRTVCGNPAARRTGHAVKSRRSSRRLPAWGQVLTAGAACAVLLVGLNGINPALAEGLPLLGDVFAYFNDLPKGYLQGNDLGEYAQPTQIEAEVQQNPTPEARDETAPKVQAAAGNILTENPCTLTLSQVYCDELYLRVGLVLTAEDDTLAGFDAVTIDPPLLYEDTTEAEANTLYGGVTLNGESVGGDLVPCFRKQDDHTFFCEMQYNLQSYTGDTRDMQASLTFSHLVGITEWSEDKIPLEGTYNLNFTVSEDASLTRVGQIDGGEQNGVRLVSVKVTPGETQMEYAVFGPLPGDATPALRAFAVQGENLTKLQPAAGSERWDEVQSCTVHTDYFDAVPEGVTELRVQMLDKNAEEEVLLAEWTVTLP